MTGRLLAAAVVSAALAMPAAVVHPASAAARVAVPALAVAPIPCPEPTPPVDRPARPVPPPDNPLLRVVGGAALATSGLVVPTGAPRPPAVTATSWVVADLDTGSVLGGCGPHDYGTPASVQKLLLAATLLPRLDPRRVVTVTREDMNFEAGSSAVGLLVGGRYPVETLWLGLLLNSGNDAANVLARIGGGAEGVAGTLRAMNEEARRLGAFQTHAVTPSGLDAPGQFTSAYDLALIARECFANEVFRRYAATERAQIPAQPPRDKTGFQIQNENRLLFRYRGALGGKTGFTTLARHSYVGAAQRNGRRLVVTLLGAEARPLRGWQQGAALLDWGFALPRDASVGHLVEPEQVAPAASAEPTPVPVDHARVGGSLAAPPGGVDVLGRGAWPLVALAAVVVAGTTLILVAAARRRRRRLRMARWREPNASAASGRPRAGRSASPRLPRGGAGGRLG